MGSSNSSSVKQFIDNSTDIRNSVSVSIKSGATTQSTSTQVNAANIRVGVASDCCSGLSPVSELACVSNLKNATIVGDLNISQTISGKVLVSQTVTDESHVALLNDVLTSVSNKVTEVLEQKNDEGILSSVFGQDNESDIQTRVDNSIRADLEVKFTKETQSKIRSASGQINASNPIVCGSIQAKNLNISQNLTMDLYIENVLSSISDIISNNKEAQNIANVATATAKQTNTNFISDFADSLSTIAKAIIIGIVAVVVIALILGVVLMLRKKGGMGGLDSGSAYGGSGSAYGGSGSVYGGGGSAYGGGGSVYGGGGSAYGGGGSAYGGY